MDKYNSKVAAMLGKMNGNPLWAITISSTCTLYSCSIEQVTDRWRKHEEEHKRQWREVPFFLIRYIWQSIRHGYNDNMYEQQARAAALK